MSARSDGIVSRTSTRRLRARPSASAFEAMAKSTHRALARGLASTHDVTVLRVRSLDHVVLRVRDVDASLRFYRDVLGLAVEAEDGFRRGERPFLSVRIGDALLDLVPDATYERDGGADGLLHFCVTVDGDFAAAVRELRAAGVPLVHDEPVRRGGARSEGLSIYVQDPDGHVVEVKEH